MTRTPWRVTVGFALFGLAMAALSYAYAALHDYTKPYNLALLAISVVLCPTQLLFAFCIDCEAVGWGGLFIYSIMGGLNVVLYAAIGAAVTGLLRNHIDQSSSTSS
jgi:hypothetical protein